MISHIPKFSKNSYKFINPNFTQIKLTSPAFAAKHVWIRQIHDSSKDAKRNELFTVDLEKKQDITNFDIETAAKHITNNKMDAFTGIVSEPKPEGFRIFSEATATAITNNFADIAMKIFDPLGIPSYYILIFLMIPNIVINFTAHFAFKKEKIRHAKAQAELFNLQKLYGTKVPDDPREKAHYLEALQNIQKSQYHRLFTGIIRGAFFMLSFYIYRNLPDDYLKLPVKYEPNWDIESTDDYVTNKKSTNISNVESNSALTSNKSAMKKDCGYSYASSLFSMESLRQRDSYYMMPLIYLFVSVFPLLSLAKGAIRILSIPVGLFLFFYMRNMEIGYLIILSTVILFNFLVNFSMSRPVCIKLFNLPDVAAISKQHCEYLEKQGKLYSTYTRIERKQSFVKKRVIKSSKNP